jgi:putative ABC transport system permease protein
MGAIFQDIRHAVRMLLKARSFALIAILTLAFGIGANSMIFSWINATLLTPVPGMARTSEVVQVCRGESRSLAYLNFVDLRDRSHSFNGLTAFATGPISLTERGKPERIWGTVATGNYFDVLGVKPILGRGFLPDEDQFPRGASVVVLSYRLWQRRFGGDQNIVGKTIGINTHPYTIIGVAPPVFQGSITGLRSELWIPITTMAQLSDDGDATLRSRKGGWLNALGRLRPGTSREQAQADLSALMQQISLEHPESGKGSVGVSLYPMWRSPNGANGFFSVLLPILMALAGVVLLLACANIANLLLARGVTRQKEMAVRLSLGAGRWRLIRLLLVENMILALAGGGAALLVTFLEARSFMDFAPKSELPIWVQVNIDNRVLLVTLGFSLLTALLSGILPALRASAASPNSVLKDEAGAVSGGLRKSRLSTGLAVAQIALSLVLLVSAGLFVRSFRATQQFNPGFSPQGVLVASYDLGLNGYKEAAGVAFHRQVLEKTQALPGIQTASLADWVPLGYSSNSDEFVPSGYVSGPQEEISAGVAHVSPGYFATMQIPLLQGRDFSPQDSEGAQPVVIVNQTLAERYWPHQDPTGKQMKIEKKTAVVVGVVRTSHYYQLNEKPEPFIYLPLYQFYSGRAVLHVRNQGDSLAAAGAVEQVIHQFNPDLPVFDVTTLNARIGVASFVQKMAGTFVGGFGVLALLLAAVGIYGVIAYGTKQRTHEIGIRMALGAEPRDVLRLVLGKGLKMTFIGIALGAIAALAVTRLMHSLLFSVSATDPLTFLGVTVLLALVALLACYVPARSAMRVDPMVALRDQ